MYLFYLYHPDLMRYKRITDPVGWDAMGKKLKRELKWQGVFFEYSPKLKFVKDGRAMVQYFFEKYDIEAEVTLAIYKKNRSTRKYEPYYTGRLNFTSYSINDIYAEVNIEQTGFTQLFKNKADLKVNLGSTVDIPLHSRVIRRITKSQIMEGDDVGPISVPGDNTFYIKFANKGNERDEVGTRQDYGTQISFENPVEVGKYDFKLDSDGSYDWRVFCPFSLVTGTESNWELQWYFVYGKPGAYTEVLVGDLYEFTASTVVTGATGVGGVFDPLVLNMTAGDEVYIYARVDIDRIGSGTNDTYYDPWYNPLDAGIVRGYLEVIGDTTYPATTAQGVFAFEAFKKVVESNTKRTNVFKSSLYARTENGAATDGEGSLRAILSGRNVRGFDVSQFASWNDLYNGFDPIDGIGVGIEKIAGKETVVVEKLAYFYSNKRSVRLDYVRNIEKEVLDDFYYNAMDVAYPNWNNEEVNNLEEFNSVRQYELPITQVQKTLQLRSKFIAAGATLESVRRDNILISNTKDNDRDNDLFVVQMRRDGENLVPMKNEGMLVNVVNASSVYNALLSPMRNVVRNGQRIRGGLYKRDGENITLTAGEGNVDFYSMLLATESDLLYENSIAVNKLGKALWIPQVYKFKTKLSQAQLDTIEANLYDYIEFSKGNTNHKKGYLLELSPDPKSELTTFTLLRANL